MSYINDLKNEIVNDVLTIGYGLPALPVAGSFPSVSHRVHKEAEQQTINQSIADLLNSKSTGRVSQHRVLTQNIVRYMASQDVLIDIIDHRSAAPANARPARSIIELIQNPHMPDVDINEAAFQAGLTSLVADGVITAPQSTAITTMGNVPISRAQELGFEEVAPGHVAMARLK